MNLSSPSTSKLLIPEEPFLSILRREFDRVLRYESKSLLSLAKSHIPVDELQIKAIESIRDVQRSIKMGSNQKETSFEDSFLVQLLSWFKNDFFKWVNCPPCDFCSAPTKHSHVTKKIVSDEYIRVEVYVCLLCETKTEFPRYKNPQILLNTRKGRCGEWANCFTMMCRAMGYDARFVIDSTDHVWTEVYSHSMKRWLHCDPCENAIDTPLMYECGWGKKLSYIIAYSKDDIQDVTWRYSCNHKEVLTRRTKCSEGELIDTLIKLRELRWCTARTERINYIKKRLAVELVELLCERKPQDEEKISRISGSLSWRLGRKEMTFNPYVIILEDFDVACVRYRSSFDTYEILYDGNLSKTIEGWMNGAYEVENVHRKEEHDWKIVYLAREENTSTAKISWKITLPKNKNNIAKIKLKVSSEVFQNGKVDWHLHLNDFSYLIPKNDENDFYLNNIQNVNEFILTANLSGGEGSCAWQHSQILRQEMGSNQYSLEITIYS